MCIITSRFGLDDNPQEQAGEDAGTSILLDVLHDYGSSHL